MRAIELPRFPPKGKELNPSAFSSTGTCRVCSSERLFFYPTSKAMRGLAVRRIVGRLRQALLLDPVIPASHGSSSMGVRYIPL